MFRFLAALGRTFEVANSYGNLAVILNMILSGFVMSKDNIHPWWIWVRSGRDLGEIREGFVRGLG